MKKFIPILGGIIVIILLILLLKKFTFLVFPLLILAIIIVTIASYMRISVSELINIIKKFFRKK